MVRIKAIVFLLLIGIAEVACAQVNRYMIFFSDKQGTGHTIDHPETFLNERSIQRRITQDIDVVAEDLPVTASYVQNVRATGATVLYKTRWLNGVLVECTAAQLAEVNALAFVKAGETEFVAPGSSSGKRSKSNKLKLASEDEDETAEQLAMLGIDEMHEDGYEGEGVIVAVIDGGFLGVNTASAFQDVMSDQINLGVSWDFTAHSSDVFKYGDHGTGVLSVIAVYKPGEFTGAAYKASFQLYVTEAIASEYRVEEYNWLFAAERADSSGVDVINTSLGYNTFDDESMDYTKSQMDGNTTVITRAAQIAASKGIFLVNSAGNSGADSWGIITAPADAEDVLAVGNIRLDGTRYPSSSTGPTADNRIKPDVVAFGAGVYAYFGNGTIGKRTGTSFSSPLVAGLIAGIRERYPNVTRAELMDAVRFSASQHSNPDNQLGYGIPTYGAIVNYLDNITGVEPNQNQSLIVYPNPVQDTFTITPRNSSILPLTEVSVLNTQGQTVTNNKVEYHWTDNSYSINIGHFLPGVYFLTVRVGKKYETYKLVKI